MYPSRNIAAVTCVLVLLIAAGLSACRCSCDCRKTMGCTIIYAKLKSNDSIIASRTYCATANWYTDSLLHDSVSAFYIKYQTNTSKVESRDSLYGSDNVRDIKCKDVDDFRRDGFDCECAK